MTGPNHLCPACGAESPRHCELEDEAGGLCPWIESGQYDRDSDTSDDQEDDA